MKDTKELPETFSSRHPGAKNPPNLFTTVNVPRKTVYGGGIIISLVTVTFRSELPRKPCHENQQRSIDDTFGCCPVQK